MTSKNQLEMTSCRVKRSKWRFNLSLVAIFILFSVAVISLVSYNLEISFNRYKLLHLETTIPQQDVKIVLFWTKFFGEPKWGMLKDTYHEDDLEELGCPISNCILTFNKDYLDFHNYYDAIMFHSAENWFMSDIPSVRSPHQLYVMSSLESPGEIKHNLKLDREFYNLTMSYRLDSDIVWTYGIVRDKITGQIVAPNYDPAWRGVDEIEDVDDDIMSVIKAKSKTAVWFVSHCDTASGRDELTKQLQSHGVEVDVYGKCGTKTCPKHSLECDQMLNTTYKFYFSYENTLCSDYITEKVFNVMRNFIIPVVFNGAEMKRFLPPKSYINAENFETVQDLADYLNFLSENPSEYIKYFWWKNYYEIQPAGAVPICEICAKVNQYGSNRRQVYDDMFQWFYDGKCRKSKLEL